MVAGWFGEHAWWLDLGAHFKFIYLLVFCLVAAAYAWDRRWLIALGAAGFAGANLLPLLPYLRGACDTSTGVASSCRAMMVNVNTFHGDPSRVAAAIRAERPDILLLLEVDRRWLSSMGPALGDFAYRLVEPRPDNFGIALFSRLPWEDARVVFIGEANLPSVQARIRIGDSWLCVLGTHPPPPVGHRMWSLRNDQLSQLGRYVRGIAGPLIVFGDLNTTPWAYHFGRFMAASGLENSALGRGIHGTWPIFARPFALPIDHFLYRGQVVVLGRREGADLASDHLPIIVDFGIGTPPRRAQAKPTNGLNFSDRPSKMKRGAWIARARGESNPSREAWARGRAGGTGLGDQALARSATSIHESGGQI